MEIAILENNKVYCPKCRQANYQLTNDLKLVSVNGKNCTEFVARCLTENCNEKFYYQSYVTLSKTERFNFDKSKEIEIKEEN